MNPGAAVEALEAHGWEGLLVYALAALALALASGTAWVVRRQLAQITKMETSQESSVADLKRRCERCEEELAAMRDQVLALAVENGRLRDRIKALELQHERDERRHEKDQEKIAAMARRIRGSG